jgi:hypothetical protein
VKRPPGPYALLPNGALARSLELLVPVVPPVVVPLVVEVLPVAVLVDEVEVEVVVLVGVLVVVDVLVGVLMVVVVEVGEDRTLVTVWHKPVRGSMIVHVGEMEIWAWETWPPPERSRRVMTSAKLAPTET